MSDENKEETKQEIKTIKCKNCLKEIEESKFFLHEGFCLRNNVICTICKEPVTKDALESHMEDHKKEKEEKEREEKLKKLVEERKKKDEEEKERAKKLIEEQKKKEEEMNKIKQIQNNNMKQSKNNNVISHQEKNSKIYNNKINNNNKNNQSQKKSTNIESTKKRPGLVAIGYNLPPDKLNELNNSKKINKNINSHVNQDNNNNKLKNKDLYTLEDGMTVGEYWAKFGGNPPQHKDRSKENNHSNFQFKRKPVIIDKSLDCKKCEYCSNYVDNLAKHYLECNAKKMIDQESRQYKINMKNRTNNDEAMAKILQKKYGNINTGGDYAMAQRLQKQFMPNTKGDEMMARRLQSQFGPNTKNDEIMARNLQKQFGYNVPNTKMMKL